MGEDKNIKIMQAMVDHQEEARKRKENNQTMAKKAKDPEKKKAFLEEVAAWSKREAKWADEIAFRKSMNF